MNVVGMVIGAAAALLLVGALEIAAFSLDRIRERRRHRRLLESLGEASSPDVKPRSEVTLEGKVVADEPAVSFHPYGASFLEEPNVYAISAVPKLVVDLHAGKRAILEGAVQVVVGSVETEHKAPLDSADELGVAQLASGKVRTRVGQFRLVRAGDPVRVRGVIEPAPDDDALYREVSNAFRLAPASSEAPGVPAAIPIAATGVVERRRLGRDRSRSLALGAVLVVGVVAGALVPATRKVVAPGAPVPSPKPPACRQALLDHADTTQECDDAYAKAVVRYMAGDFVAASTGFKQAVAQEPGIPPSLDEAETHLFAHDYVATTATVERMVHHFYPGPSTAEKRDLECILGLLLARLEEAGPVLRGWNGRSYRRICSTRPFVKLARELDAKGAFDGEDHGELWKEYINGVYLLPGASDPLAVPRTTAFGTRERLLARPVGIERRVIDALGLEESAYSVLVAFGVQTSPSEYFALTTPLAAELALFYAFSGFPNRAAKLWPMLDRVADVTSSQRRHFSEPRPGYKGETERLESERLLLESVMSVGAAAALFAGDSARAVRYGNLGEPHSGRLVVQLESMLRPGAGWEEPIEDGHWPPHSQLFAAGRTGDGAEVVRLLAEQKVTGRETLARILPLLRRNREALNAWFRSAGYPSPCLQCGASSFHGHLSDCHEVARLLGEKDDGTALVRFTDALTDPEIAFDVDELETFFHRDHQD